MDNDPGTAVLFPGQGSHERGMRDLVAALEPDLLDRCTYLVGEDPFLRVEESTRFAQPAIFCASVARWNAFGGDVDQPLAAAGHSLGELAALVAADALDPFAALELVVLRGSLMADAGEQATRGTMLALLGTDADTAEVLAAKHDAVLANDNAPGQLVLSGTVRAIEALAAACREQGLRALELDVAGAFHSPAMSRAVQPFAQALRDADFRPPRFPVISGMTTRPMNDPVRELSEALTAPVRWTGTMSTLRAMGATRFVDAGPGKVLAKLVKRNAREATAEAFADLQAVDA